MNRAATTMSPNEWLALEYIRRHPGCRIGHVRKHLGCSYAGAGVVVFNLRLMSRVRPPTRGRRRGEVWPIREQR